MMPDTSGASNRPAPHAGGGGQRVGGAGQRDRHPPQPGSEGQQDRHLPAGGAGQQVARPGRHPEDPEPVLASKARAVWWLGLVALLTGPLLGGLIPATIAFLLAAQFRREAGPAQGFLTGAARVRRGERMAWIGVLFAAAALSVALVAALYQLASTPSGPDFGPEVD